MSPALRVNEEAVDYTRLQLDAWLHVRGVTRLEDLPEFTMVTFPIPCSACRSRGWVFDRVRQPKDDWAEFCKVCDGYGGFTLQSLSGMLKVPLGLLRGLYENRARNPYTKYGKQSKKYEEMQSFNLQVLEGLAKRGLLMLHSERGGLP